MIQVAAKGLPNKAMKQSIDGNIDINAMKPTGKKVKKKRMNHSQLGADFVAPDGGFGWFICLAAGVSNVRAAPASFLIFCSSLIVST